MVKRERERAPQMHHISNSNSSWPRRRKPKLQYILGRRETITWNGWEKERELVSELKATKMTENGFRTMIATIIMATMAIETTYWIDCFGMLRTVSSLTPALGIVPLKATCISIGNKLTFASHSSGCYVLQSLRVPSNMSRREEKNLVWKTRRWVKAKHSFAHSIIEWWGQLEQMGKLHLITKTTRQQPRQSVQTSVITWYWVFGAMNFMNRLCNCYKWNIWNIKQIK